MIFSHEREDRRDHEKIDKGERTNNWSLERTGIVINDVVRGLVYSWYSTVDGKGPKDSHYQVEDYGQPVSEVNCLCFLLLSFVFLDYGGNIGVTDKGESVD